MSFPAEASRAKGKARHHEEGDSEDSGYDMKNFSTKNPTLDAGAPYDDGVRGNLLKDAVFGDSPGMIPTPKYNKDFTIKQLLITKEEEAYTPDVARPTTHLLPMAYGFITIQENQAGWRDTVEYVQVLNKNYGTLWRMWAETQERAQTLHDTIDRETAKRDAQIGLLQNRVNRLEKDKITALTQRNAAQDNVKNWERELNRAKEEITRLRGRTINPRATSNLPAAGGTPAPNKRTIAPGPRVNGFLKELRHRCNNLRFTADVNSFPPPAMFTGDPEFFQPWCFSLLHYFQHHKKDFGRTTQDFLAVFAQTRLEGKPSVMIQARTRNGYQFPDLFSILETLYRVYGIKDTYDYYDRKFRDLRWPSGPDQVRNLEDFKAAVGPIREELNWPDGLTIRQVLPKLPKWARAAAAHQQFDMGSYDSFLDHLDDYFSRNQLARSVTAASRHSG
ncbi:MAG: hypothetical protein M1840_000808 [Geoglossum simile]|nr:MAG: hypothetical protein M1840_000808 [Geoglossum simile]